MTPTGEAEARYAALLAKVARFWDRAFRLQPEGLPCQPGCAACCRALLTVLPVEAAHIRASLAVLTAAERSRLAAHLTSPPDPDACPFLVEDRCVIYESRPIICRTHGLALRTEGGIDHCPLCFIREAPHPEGILSLETINTLLVLLNRLWLSSQGLGEDAPREALAHLAVEATRRAP